MHRFLTRVFPVTGAAVALALSGCGEDAGGGGGAQPRVTGSRGADLVTAQNCLSCHRIGNQGDPQTGGDLTRIGAQRDRAVIATALVEPPTGMPDYDSLPAEDRRAIVDYLAGLR